ncbi:MAG: hypothetical protein GXO00_00225 [Candidatus Diapherotrites archaeon]|nr:hypothetical protein [Candidatus Diapherotrites archaeon]
MTTVWSSVLLGIDGPTEAYSHEIFPCFIYVSAYEGEHDVRLYPHDADGLFEVLSPIVELNVEPYTVESVEINCWAKDAGVDALVVDAEYDGKKLASLYPLRFVNPPVAVSYPTLSLEAGRSGTLEVKVSGEALNLRLWLESPTSSITVSDPVDLGDLSGEKTAEFVVTPSPTAVGAYKLYLYVSYVDERGRHLLRYEVDVWVNPSFILLAIGLALLFLILVTAYIGYKRWKGDKKEIQPPIEAQ